MVLQGNLVCPLPLSCPDFQTCCPQLDCKLARIYKVSYLELGPCSLDADIWADANYFHGTGHCGCVSARMEEKADGPVPASEWCTETRCQTRGILKNGHLKLKSREGNAEMVLLVWPHYLLSPHLCSSQTHRTRILKDIFSRNVLMWRKHSPATDRHKKSSLLCLFAKPDTSGPSTPILIMWIMTRCEVIARRVPAYHDTEERDDEAYANIFSLSSFKDILPCFLAVIANKL